MELEINTGCTLHQSSGGQYHYCFILAPLRTRRFAAYITGWMSVLAWCLVTCSGVSLAAVSTVGIAAFFNPGFVVKPYQIWLVYVAIAFITGKIGTMEFSQGFVTEFYSISIIHCSKAYPIDRPDNVIHFADWVRGVVNHHVGHETTHATGLFYH